MQVVQETLAGKSRAHIAVLAYPWGDGGSILHQLTLDLSVKFPLCLFSFICRQEWFDRTPMVERSNVELFLIRHDSVPFYSFEQSVAQYEDELTKAVNQSGNLKWLIADFDLGFGDILANTFKVKWIGFWSNSFYSLAAALYKENFTVNGFSFCSASWIKNLKPLEMWDIYKIRTRVKFETLPMAIVVNSPQNLEFPPFYLLKSIFLNVFGIPMPFLPSDTNVDDARSWLDARPRRSVLLIFADDLHGNSDLADALVRSNIRFLWCSRKEMRDFLPQGFVKRTSGRAMFTERKNSSYIHHSSIRLFVTDGNWSDILNALYAGVQIVCRPRANLEYINARIVADFFIAGVTQYRPYSNTKFVLSMSGSLSAGSTHSTLKTHVEHYQLQMHFGINFNDFLNFLQI